MSCVFSINMVCEVLDPWSLGKSEEEIDNHLKDYLKESYGAGKMKTIKKGSDVFMENYTLQCSTKDTDLTKENVKKVVDALREMKNKNLATNEKSIFEVNIKDKKQLNNSELLWEFCNLVNDDKMVEGLSKVYSSKQSELLGYIQETHKLLKENDFPKLSKYLKENKERIIKLNSRDKLSVKLPSNFLKEEFIDKLETVMGFLCNAEEIGNKALESTELNGIKKETFLEILAI